MTDLPFWLCEAKTGAILSAHPGQNLTTVSILHAGRNVAVSLSADALSHLGAHLMALADDMGRKPAMPKGAHHFEHRNWGDQS